MAKIEIYTRDGCGFCVMAKRLLDKADLTYIEYNVYQQPDKVSEMRQRTNGHTYPQILIDDQSIGGCDDLMSLARQGKLPIA